MAREAPVAQQGGRRVYPPHASFTDHDPMSGFYLLRKEVYERASATANSRGYKILLELLIKGHAASVAEVPIHFQNRRFGKSKLSVKVLYRDAINVIELRKFQKTEDVLTRISVI
jgi:hypothetical protein